MNFDKKEQMKGRGFSAKDHYEKWGGKAHSAEATEDYARRQYEDWMRKQTEEGKY